MLDEFNVHAKCFRMVRDRYRDQPFDDLKLRLIADRTKDGRIYSVPNVSEVAALIVGDVDTASWRDIIMEKQSGKLQRINELHTSYLGFQYPLSSHMGKMVIDMMSIIDRNQDSTTKGTDSQLGSGFVLDYKRNNLKHKLCLDLDDFFNNS